MSQDEVQESQDRQLTEKEISKTDSGNGKSSNAGIFVSYRLPKEDFQAMELIAKHLHAMGTINSPTVSSLAKACLYTQINLFTLIESQNQTAIEYDKRMKELQESIAKTRVPVYHQRFQQYEVHL